jgi:hypothetical protein
MSIGMRGVSEESCGSPLLTTEAGLLEPFWQSQA